MTSTTSIYVQDRCSIDSRNGETNLHHMFAKVVGRLIVEPEIIILQYDPKSKEYPIQEAPQVPEYQEGFKNYCNNGNMSK